MTQTEHANLFPTYPNHNPILTPTTYGGVTNIHKVLQKTAGQQLCYFMPRRLPRGTMFSPGLSRCPAVWPVPTPARPAAEPRWPSHPTTMAVGKSIPVPTWTYQQAGESIAVENGIIRRAGKSIIQMLLWGIK